jgi:hypothetical protein
MDQRNEQRFQAQKEAINAALASADKATDKYALDNERWRASANEWRGAMSDRDRELPSRREVDSATSALDARVRLLEDLVRGQRGRSEGIGLSAGVIVGGAGLVATVLTIAVIAANVLTG